MTLRQGQEKSFRAQAPPELTGQRLLRLGEGIGKVVYASEHWVVKRERSPTEIVALIAIWKIVRRTEHMLPGTLGRRLLEKPSRQLRFLRVALHGVLFLIPEGMWISSHLGTMWRVYRRRDIQGARLAEAHLAGSGLVPEQIEFPPTRIRVGGWPGWLTVSAATERVEDTLYQRLFDLARINRFDQIEIWLDRFLELRQTAWKRGIFSTDAHLKNFGVTGARIVLLDPGGLTQDWKEIEGRLAYEEVVNEPYIRLGLGPMLGARPDLAAKFNARWKALVNRDQVALRLGIKRST